MNLWGGFSANTCPVYLNYLNIKEEICRKGRSPSSNQATTSSKGSGMTRNTEITLNTLKSTPLSEALESNLAFACYRMDAIGRTTEWHEGH